MHLQEAEQTIIRYDKCNKKLKKLLERESNVVREGVVCAYNNKGKDSCKVSSWALCYLCILVVPSKVTHPQAIGPALPASSSIHFYSS